MLKSSKNTWIPFALAVVLLIAWLAISRRTDGSLVVYCTHDLVYAEPVLEDFTRQTGIPVTVVGDTEATKSLGLVERLLREGEATPCDLFWNNEVLGTIRLQRKGLLTRYSGTAAERIPAQFRDPGGEWFGFGGRLRVWIANPGKLGDNASSVTPEMIAARFAQPDLSRMAIAKPLYGTTFSQFTMLWKLHGGEQTQREHLDLVARGCQFVAGNAMVRDVVAGGGCDFGVTDTDDVFSARDSGYKVEMQPIRIDHKTICIPNTVSILKSSDRPTEAQRLLEYLLSESVELELARTARQIPLGTVSEEKIPNEVRPLVAWARESWNVAAAADVAPACLEWLKAEYAR